MRKGYLSPQKDRLMLDLRALGLPEVPLVGMHHQARAGRGLDPHIHAGLMEICYLTRGERVYHVGGADYPFKGNEIFVTYPDELHGSGANPHGKGLLYWMQLRLPRKPKPFLALASREAWPLVEALRNLPRRKFRGDRRLKPIYEKIVAAAQESAPDGEASLKRLEIANLLLEWLLLVLRCARQAGSSPVSSDVRSVLERIEADPGRSYVLEELAESVHLSASRFKAKFKEQVGIPPAEYILRRKVEHARKLLAGGKVSITAVAYQLGFSSSQYFATVFKRFTGARPRDALVALRKGGKMSALFARGIS